jgi:RNA-directed DNA polymerase
MKNVSPKRWSDISWGKAARYLFRLQQRVFDAEIYGDKGTVVRYQQKIANSFYAKAMAVRQVAQISSGRKTAGIDGVKSPTPAEKMHMATGLTIHHQPSMVLRKWIPKPGKDELRPLGIPNLIDRAHQALLVLILEPQWEAHFSEHQYGFRKGRGPHDAIDFITRHLRKAGPKWVLELDIEKFFDCIDHEELIRRLDAPPVVADAVRRCLKAGVLDEIEHDATDVGTPQGGPLSPLLANVAMAGLEAHLEREFRRVYAGRITALGMPSPAIYADDAVVMHKDRSVVAWSQAVIQSYLDPLGLRLSENKTRISHTQQPTRPGEGAGFDFLGFHVQHVWTKKPGGNKVPYIMVTPSKRSVARFYRDCAERIDMLKLSRKQRGARRDRQALGKKDPVTIMIRDLNRKIRGWVNYFCICNAKHCFGRLDHLLHEKLWKWAVRRFDRKKVGWIKENLFSGVEVDKNGKPLLRLDGNPRERKWAFKSPFVPKDKPHLTLMKLADTPIRNHILVRPEKRFYDGRWTYWQLRMKTRYPGTPPMVSIAAFRRQKGNCAICGKLILMGERLIVGKQDRLQVISHSNCIITSPSSALVLVIPPTTDPDSGCPMQAQYGETRPLGFSGS